MTTNIFLHAVNVVLRRAVVEQRRAAPAPENLMNAFAIEHPACPTHGRLPSSPLSCTRRPAWETLVRTVGVYGLQHYT